jgi:hypothetical protein
MGGESADTGGTEIADSCHSVAKIVAAYEKVITTYKVTRLDMDIEGKSLNNKAGLTRRSEAIAQLQQWADRTGHVAQVDLTLGVVQSRAAAQFPKCHRQRGRPSRRHYRGERHGVRLLHHQFPREYRSRGNQRA